MSREHGGARAATGNRHAVSLSDAAGRANRMRDGFGMHSTAKHAGAAAAQRENTGSRGAPPRQQSFLEHSLSDALEGRVGYDRAPDVSRRQVTEYFLR